MPSGGPADPNANSGSNDAYPCFHTYHLQRFQPSLSKSWDLQGGQSSSGIIWQSRFQQRPQLGRYGSGWSACGLRKRRRPRQDW